MQRLGKIENAKKKIHARAKKLRQRGIGNFVRASGSGQGEISGSGKKFRREKGEKKQE